MRLLLCSAILICICSCDCLPIVQRSYEFMDISEHELRTANAALGQTSSVISETAASLKAMENELKTANKRLAALDILMKRFGPALDLQEKK